MNKLAILLPFIIGYSVNGTGPPGIPSPAPTTTTTTPVPSTPLPSTAPVPVPVQAPAPSPLTVLQVAAPASLSPPAPGYIEAATSGIHNFAVNCYANAALQVLNSIPVFVNAVLQVDPNVVTQTMLMTRLQSILYQMRHTPLVRISEHLIRGLFGGIRAMNAPDHPLSRMQLGSQHDGAEFFLGLLQLAIQIITPHGRAIANNCEFTRQGFLTALPGEAFGAEDQGQNLLLLQSNWTRGDAFEDVLSRNLHEVTDADYRGGAGIQYDMKLRRSPPVLLVKIPRTLAGEVKFRTPLPIPLQLDITRHVRPAVPTTVAHVYDLRSVIVHIGERARSGHYISLIRNLNNSTWLKIDDSIQTMISQQEFQDITYGTSSNCSTANLLVYVKRAERVNVMGAHITWPAYVAQNYAQTMIGAPPDTGADVDSRISSRFLGGTKLINKVLVSEEDEEAEKPEEDVEKEEEEDVEEEEGVTEWGKSASTGIETFTGEVEDPEDFLKIFGNELLPERTTKFTNLPAPDIIVNRKKVAT